MIITKKINIGINKNNIKHYKSKGYTIPKDKRIIINTKDIHYNINTKIEIRCDICFKTFESKANIYLAKHKDKEHHACNICSKKYAEEKVRKRKLTTKQFNHMYRQV